MTDRPRRRRWWRRLLGSGRRGAPDPAPPADEPEPEHEEHRTGHVLFTARRTPPAVEQRPPRVLPRAQTARNAADAVVGTHAEPPPAATPDHDATQRELSDRYDTLRHVTQRGDGPERHPRPRVRVDDAAAASPAPRRELSPSEALHLAERGRAASDATPQADTDDEPPASEDDPEPEGTGGPDHPQGKHADGGHTGPSV